jgi:DNA-binding IclR family transcriptional regulator
MAKEGVAAVDRALTVVDAFTERDHSLTLTELSRRTGFYKSTILRLSESLEKFGYLYRLDDGSFRLGPKPMLLGALYQRHFRTADVVPRALSSLVKELGESASFYIRDGERRVCLHRIDSPRAIRDTVHEGDTLPLTVGASGHVLLAFSGASGDKYDAIREKYFAASSGERDTETAAISAPVLTTAQRLSGALTISGPRYRMEELTAEEVLPILFTEARELTRAFGGNPEVFPTQLPSKSGADYPRLWPSTRASTAASKKSAR